MPQLTTAGGQICRVIAALVVIAGLLEACTHSAPVQTPSPSPLPRPASPEPPNEALPSAPVVVVAVATDASTTLQALIDDVPDGARIVFPIDGVVRLDTGLRIDGRHGIALDGNGTTLETVGCEREDSLISIGLQATSTDITIQGFRLVGGNEKAGTTQAFDPNCQFQAGVAIYGSSRVENPRRGHDRDAGGLPVRGIGRSGDWSTDVSFRDSRCRSNGRQAVSVVAGERVSVEHIDMDVIAMHVLDIEPNDARGGARDVLFLDNVVGSYAYSDAFTGFFFGANGSLDAPVDRVLVSGNAVRDGTLHILVGDEFTGWNGQRNRRSIEVSANSSIVSAAGPVMTFKHVDGLVVSGNSQPLTDGQLVRLVDVTGAVVE